MEILLHVKKNRLSPIMSLKTTILGNERDETECPLKGGR